MTVSRTFGLIALCALASSFGIVSAIDGYDIRCIYPPGLPEDPFQARADTTGVYGEYNNDNQIETPIVIRVAHWHTVCQTMCLAYHAPGVKDPITKGPTYFTVPEFGQNAWSIIMCSAQCYPHVYEGSGDLMERGIEDYKNRFGMFLEEPSARLDIKNALDEAFNGNPSAGIQILLNEQYHPYTVGHMLGFLIRGYMDEDGWNSLGDEQFDNAMSSTMPCTGSCRNYQDTSGYVPVPDPRLHEFLNEDSNEYECTGLCRRWQPLQEGDSFGNLKLQEFITPHIGTKAHTFLRDPTITLEDPEYDLYEESLLVIERMKNMTMDQYKQDAIEYFDNKRLVRRIVQNGIKHYKTLNVGYSFQEHLLYLMGLSTAEYDGVIQGWHEKRYHDLVRPTTVIKHWGDDELYTYGGDMSIGGPVTIKARDFEAFIRVMPHPEFPSGSSCLCTAYQEFTDEYTNYMFNETLTDQWFWRHKGREYPFEYLTEMVDVCGESRLWGGMHFTAAIDAGAQICQGLGALAVDYVNEIRNDSTFGANPWFFGDELGECPTR